MSLCGVAYGVSSLFAVHANLATIGSHIIYDDDLWRLDFDPPNPFPEPGATPMLHTIHLAQYVFKEFGLSEDGVEAMGDAVLEAMKIANKAADPSATV